MIATEDRHILSRYDGDLRDFHELVLRLGGTAQQQVSLAASALASCDIAKAGKVLAGYKLVRNLDMQAQEANLQVFAVHQPVARDLRYVFMLSRTAYDLERVNDEAVKIAHLVEAHFEQRAYGGSCDIFSDVERMGDTAVRILGASLQALDGADLAAAIAVVREEAHLGALFQSALRRLATYIMEDPRNMRWIIDATLALKAMERVGDHAISIAKNLIFATSGKDVRYIHPDNLEHDFLIS